ncbi:MAG TPA: hypothetical protein VGE29_22025 [Prosthecobacter sp.]
MMRFPRPGCRYRFTAADWQFIRDALALTQREKESLASLLDDPETVRMVLDHPKLFEALLVSRQAAFLSPELFFYVTVRHTLKRVGVDDLAVADYIAVVCADFGLPATAEQHLPERKLENLYSIDYITALESAGSHERFFIHVQCANQFLVLTSLYPDFLRHRAQRRGAPDLEFYEQVVISHLQAAGRHALAEEFALDDTLAHVAQAFPPARRAMNHTVREYLSLGA